MTEGQRPLSVGFFFSLGHSTVVVALGVLVGLGVSGLSGSIRNDGSALHEVTGLIGPLVSGSFLLAIGIFNLVVLANVVRDLPRMRRGDYDEAELERELDSRGFMGRYCRRATGAVRKPWQMYPLGCLFGLGFDTATEVALLVLAGGAGAGRAALLRDPLPPDPLRRRDDPARHDRRHLHDLRLRLGALAAGSPGLLQPHGHRPVGGRRAADRVDRAGRRARRRSSVSAVGYGVGQQTSTSTSSATSSSRSSPSPGRSPSPSGTSAGSRRSGSERGSSRRRPCLARDPVRKKELVRAPPHVTLPGPVEAADPQKPFP